MGIRYHAFPVRAAAAAVAAAAPQEYFRSLARFAGDPPLADADEDRWYEENASTEHRWLDLDKGWEYLQCVLSDGSEPARAGFELVRGDVEHTSTGWRAFVRVLTSDQVRAAALDLATVTEAEVRDRLRPIDDDADAVARHIRDVEHTWDHLEQAVLFTQELAREGWGLAYAIG